MASNTALRFRRFLQQPHVSPHLLKGDMRKVLELAKAELGFHFGTCLVCGGVEVKDPNNACKGCNGQGVVARILEG